MRKTRKLVGIIFPEWGMGYSKEFEWEWEMGNRKWEIGNREQINGNRKLKMGTGNSAAFRSIPYLLFPITKKGNGKWRTGNP